MAKQSLSEVLQFAGRNVGTGTLIEPRFYYDFIDFTGQVPTPPATSTLSSTPVYNSDPAAFVNGEQFPVRLTHVVVSPLMRSTNVQGIGAGLAYVLPEALQAFSFRLERYGEYYQNEALIRAPGWLNVHAAPPVALGNGVVTHRFFQPVVFSSRDTLRVEIEVPTSVSSVSFVPNGTTTPTETGAPPLLVSVQMTGVGMKSGRPYMFGASASVDTGTVVVLDQAQFANVGNEPIAIVEMTAQVTTSPLATVTGGSGLLADTRLVRIQVNQHGNGTQAKWFKGPTNSTGWPRMPLVLLGTHINNAVVHELPGDGFQFEPGESLRVQGQRGFWDETNNSLDSYNTAVVGLAGYLMVQ